MAWVESVVEKEVEETSRKKRNGRFMEGGKSGRREREEDDKDRRGVYGRGGKIV